MNQPLFRPEVLEARRRSWLGTISLAQPLPVWILAGFSALAASAVVGFLIFGEYTRRSSVIGQLVPDLGLSTVVAPTSGVVARLLSEEGEEIGMGDGLALIDVPRTIASGMDMLEVIREGLERRRDSLETLGSSQAEQLEMQQAGYARQLAAARRELTQIQREIQTRREQVRIGNELIERFRTAADRRYVSHLQVSQQEQAVLDMLNAQQALERQATSIDRTVAQLEQALSELPAQRELAQATTRRDLAALEQERMQQEATGGLLITAPVAGLVASRLVEPGQAVQAGQPMMSLLPEGSRLQAQLMVPSSAVGFVEPGDRVLLRYQAFPYQKFGHHDGRVVRISRSAINPGESMALAGSGQETEPYYRVLVDLDLQTISAYGNPEPLRPGMLLEADILGERRRLYEWLLEPLYSLRGKID